MYDKIAMLKNNFIICFIIIIISIQYDYAKKTTLTKLVFV